MARAPQTYVIPIPTPIEELDAINEASHMAIMWLKSQPKRVRKTRDFVKVDFDKNNSYAIAASIDVQLWLAHNGYRPPKGERYC